MAHVLNGVITSNPLRSIIVCEPDAELSWAVERVCKALPVQLNLRLVVAAVPSFTAVSVDIASVCEFGFWPAGRALYLQLMVLGCMLLSLTSSRGLSVSFTIDLINISSTSRELNVYTAASGTAGSTRCCWNWAGCSSCSEGASIKSGVATCSVSCPSPVFSRMHVDVPDHAFISVEAFPPRRSTPRFVFTLMQVCFTLETSAMSPGVGIAESLRQAPAARLNSLLGELSGTGVHVRFQKCSVLALAMRHLGRSGSIDTSPGLDLSLQRFQVDASL